MELGAELTALRITDVASVIALCEENVAVLDRVKEGVCTLSSRLR